MCVFIKQCYGFYCVKVFSLNLSHVCLQQLQKIRDKYSKTEVAQRMVWEPDIIRSLSVYAAVGPGSILIDVW